ncbi:MAG: hypothetical protein ACPGYS_04290 [Flavobacteriales bacterium]
MDEGTQIMHELEINEYRPVHEAGSVLFKVSVKETVTHHFTVRYDGEGNPIKTAKHVRADFEEFGTEGWHKKDGWSDWDSERISKVEKVVYSPCSLALQYLTPPAHWTADSHPQIRYLNRSTMFDEQPEGSAFWTDKIHRRYVRCTNYIHGKTSQICPHCLRRIKEGWSIIHPFKKEESE